MDRYLILRAKMYNWSLAYTGMWSSVTWEIYSDASFVITTAYVPQEDASDFYSINGTMDHKAFGLLKNVVVQQWGIPDSAGDACDGTGWELESYGIDGSVIQSSHGLVYIYGHSVPASLTELLPVNTAPGKKPPEGAPEGGH